MIKISHEEYSRLLVAEARYKFIRERICMTDIDQEGPAAEDLAEDYPAMVDEFIDAHRPK